MSMSLATSVLESPQSEWGVYRYLLFLEEFSESPILWEILPDVEDRRKLIEALRESPVAAAAGPPGLYPAIRQFARRRIAYRQETNGWSNIYSASRNGREGAQPAIPKTGNDAFAPILAGDPAKGPAIFVALDRDLDFPLDDLRTTQAHARAAPPEAIAVCISNRFTAFVRVMDPELVLLLEIVGFVGLLRRSWRPHPVKRTIPFGFNLVTFPTQFYSSLAAIPIPVLFGMLQATRRALVRAAELVGTSSIVYAVFCNQGPLSGCTQPRLHFQLYIRADGNPEELHSMRPAGYLGMADFEDEDWHPLHQPNRHWAAYAPPLHEGKFDVHLHPRHGGRADLFHLSDEQLLDLAEALVYHNTVLDRVVEAEAPHRNILFFPRGVVVRPFAVHGGMEETWNERIYGLPPLCFAELYNSFQVKLDRRLYDQPAAGKAEGFEQLLDRESPIYVAAE